MPKWTAIKADRHTKPRFCRHDAPAPRPFRRTGDMLMRVKKRVFPKERANDDFAEPYNSCGFVPACTGRAGVGAGRSCCFRSKFAIQAFISRRRVAWRPLPPSLRRMVRWLQHLQLRERHHQCVYGIRLQMAHAPALLTIRVLTFRFAGAGLRGILPAVECPFAFPNMRVHVIFHYLYMLRGAAPPPKEELHDAFCSRRRRM